jgi:hypothetical protein
LGEISLWHPYLTLDDSIINSRLLTLWDAETLEELQGFPPQQDATRHIRWFSQYCDGGNPFGQVDELTKQALMCFVTRASAMGMVPIDNLFNHHNGLRNAKVQLTEDGVQLMAVRPIPKGSQIYLSTASNQRSLCFVIMDLSSRGLRLGRGPHRCNHPHHHRTPLCSFRMGKLSLIPPINLSRTLLLVHSSPRKVGISLSARVASILLVKY